MLKYVSFLKDMAQIVQAVGVFLGIIVGGLWTYLLFVRKRLTYPHVNLELSVYDTILTGNRRLVHVIISIKNTGNVLLRSDYSELRMRQVIPLPTELQETVQTDCDPVPEGKAEIEWPMIAGREWCWSKNDFEIEPGESDSLHADFIINRDVQVVEFYCFISNYKKKHKALGWSLTKLHNFNTNMEANEMVHGKGNSKTRLDEQQRQQKQQTQQTQQQQQQSKKNNKAKK